MEVEKTLMGGETEAEVSPAGHLFLRSRLVGVPQSTTFRGLDLEAMENSPKLPLLPGAPCLEPRNPCPVALCPPLWRQASGSPVVSALRRGTMQEVTFLGAGQLGGAQRLGPGCVRSGAVPAR